MNLLFSTFQNKSISITVFLGLSKHIGKIYLNNTQYILFPIKPFKKTEYIYYSPLHLSVCLCGNHGG